jgi:predicted PurR-regulated permease PerM
MGAKRYLRGFCYFYPAVGGGHSRVNQTQHSLPDKPMNTRNRTLLLVFLLALLLIGAWFLKTIIVYLLIALVLSLVGSPVNKFLHKRMLGRFSIPSGVSALLSLLFIYSLLAGLIAIFIPLALEESQILANTNSSVLIASLQQPISQVDAFMSRYSPQPFSAAQFLREKLPTLIDAGQIGNLANSIVAFTGSLFVAFFAISFFTFFFLKDGKLLLETLLLLSPPEKEHDIREILHNCKRLLTKYFTGLCLDSLCVASIITLGLYCLGIPNALIIGLFAGLVNIIPYVGVFIAAGFGLFVALSTGLTVHFEATLLPLVTKVVLVFISCNLIDSMLFQPLIFSNSVKAHPLEIFLVIMITGTLAGIGPMILAVPTYTVLRVIAKQFLSRFRIIQKLTSNLGEKK